MAIPKICGIETEYGISVRDARRVQSDPHVVAVDQRVRQAGVQAREVGLRGREPAARRARLRPRRASRLPVEDESGLVNVILPNGSRYYVDHAHPEYSSPECSNARDVVIWDKAGERILEDSIEAAQRSFPTARRSSSTRTTPTARATRTGPTRTTWWTARRRSPSIVKHLIPFFVTRQVFTGRREGGGRERRRRRRLPDLAARRLLRGRGRARDDVQATDHQHARRTSCRSREVPATPRHRRRRQHGGDLDVPEGRDDLGRPQDDRGRVHHRRLSL